MTSRRLPRNPAWLLAVIAAGALVSCGGGGGGKASTPGGTTIEGNIARAMTSELERARGSKLTRIVRWFERSACAASPADTSLGGIQVSVSAGGAAVAGDTDASGDFDLTNVPAGDVTVAFVRGSCDGTVPLSDVITNSTIVLGDTAFDCNDATPAHVDETFEGLLQNKPASQSGDLQVIAQAGASNRNRVVKTDSATHFEDENGNPASFSDFNPNDLIEASGRRSGVGAASTLHAATVKKVPVTFGELGF